MHGLGIEMMARNDEARTGEHPTVQMIGSLPPWKGIPTYCQKLFEGIEKRFERVKFTGWKSLYPALLYPSGDPTTGEEPFHAENVERELSWYDPLSWLRVGLDPDVDLVHAQWWSYPLAVPYVAIFTVGKLRGKTVLLTVHNVEPHEQTRLTRFLNDVVYRFADEYVVHSEANKSQFSSKSAIDADAVHVISHPTIGPEKQDISTADARRELSIDPETDVVLFFGNIREYKGLDALIDMVADINEDRDVDLVIAGECWVEWEDYESLIARQGLEDRVHRFPGYIPEDRMELFFSAADALALPYEHFDAQSGVAEVADHFGTVSIGYDEGGLAEQVDVVATDRAEFEPALRAALDGDVEKGSVDDDSVENHVRLYRQLLGVDTRESTLEPVIQS